MSDRYDRQLEDLLRVEAPQVLGALVRRYGHFDVAEDALQEALLAAARQWPDDGLPDWPRSWLIRAASRAMIDLLRSDYARRDREERVSRRDPTEHQLAADVDPEVAGTEDDSLILLFLCCDPVLSPPSQIALTLRAVGGLTTEEIARAFLVPDATMGQRISRAKQTIKKSGARFQRPAPEDLPTRLAAVLRVLYLIFNEGYVASSGPALQRDDLAAEAIRLTRMLHARLPAVPEVGGLLALMLLTDSRRRARQGPHGELVPLREQDRDTWDREQIEEGVTLVTAALSTAPPGAYQLQAAIAAVHAEAPGTDQTDWPQILALYGVLERIQPGPVVALNRAVATAMVHGPEEGLRQVAELAVTLDEMTDAAGLRHRVAAVRAHLHQLAGAPEAAIEHFEAAARGSASVPERDYLSAQAARLRSLRDSSTEVGRVEPTRPD